MPKKKATKKRPAKHESPLDLARNCLRKGAYRDTTHAAERKSERNVSLPEIRYVLTNGWHEKSKDSYSEQWKAWNYSMRGKTVDRRELRIVISFEKDENDEILLIITTVDLSSA